MRLDSDESPGREIQNTRSSPRLSLDDSFRVTFAHEGRIFRSVPMTTLSVGGFCMRLPAQAAQGVGADHPLAGILMEHPDLDHPPVRGRVIYVLGRQTKGEGGSVLVGVAFDRPPRSLTHLLETFVRENHVSGKLSA